MSTLSLRKIKHDSSAVDNITLDSSGNVGVNKTTPRATTGFNSVSLNGTDGSEIWFDANNSAATRLSGTANETRITAQASGSVITMFTGATERVRVDNSGRVTMPYQPCFRAKINNSAYVSISNNTVLPFGVAEVNVGSHYNTSNYRFTAPINGTYMFYVAVYTRVENAQDAYPRIRVNGTNKFYSYNCHVSGITGRQDLTVVIPYLATLNAGDYVDVVIGGNGYTYNGTEETIFFGYLIG